MKREYLIISIIAVCVLISCNARQDTNGKYHPIDGFIPAFEVLDATRDTSSIDIEKTVRILNGIELARKNSDGFDSFLSYVSSEDYNLVSAEVINQEKKLLPCLQRLYVLQKAYDDYNDIWTVSMDMGDALMSTGLPENCFGKLLSSGFGSSMMNLAVSELSAARSSCVAKYKERKDNNRKVRKELDSIEKEFQAYFTEYSSVYFKYMILWDQLCLKKDAAYMALDAGRYGESYSICTQILREQPMCREAMLLKALSAIGLGFIGVIDEDVVPINTEGGINDRERWYAEANATLDAYLAEFPGCSAPALVIKGMLLAADGQRSRAVSCLDQASMEYPRQAEKLKDMLDSYNMRDYLNATAEGKSLKKMYLSTMEGFGRFSPNFAKARIYESEGNAEMGCEEIYRHFFRMAGQTRNDHLIEDLEYCRTQLPISFSQVLEDGNKVSVSMDKVFLSSSKFKIKIDNRTEHGLKNVRIFLCLHFTDMYPDEYVVMKLPTASNITAESKYVSDAVKVEFGDKTVDDIVSFSAVLITDEKVYPVTGEK